MHDPDGNMDHSEPRRSPLDGPWYGTSALSKSQRFQSILSRSFDVAGGKRSLWSFNFKPCMHRASSRSEVRDRSGQPGVGARPVTHLPFVRVTGVAACV
jgi:hypothetical protein